jgi:cyclopropane fatty-acyl-phospholipid synthase-like methyltransferase
MKFDKYEYYSKAVQSADNDVRFLKKVFRQIQKKEATTLREDFCGTFMICEEWVKMNREHQAYGVDLDSEPVDYGKKRILKSLKEEQQKRVHISLQNVLEPGLPTADIVAALNFSYYIFKQRQDLKRYFSQVFKSLKSDGVFVIDTFGGSESYEAHEEKTRHQGFTYFWDQKNYEPLTNEAKFEIHFQIKGEKRRRRKAFTYDWRLWSIAELRDILNEVGFANVVVYWEGTTKDGEGDNNFKPSLKGEECESWIAYLACSK